MAYIDRDKLNEAMYHEAFEKSSDFQKWDSGCWIRYKLFENVLKSIPTADVQEVKRGKWIYENKGDWFPSCRCSVCGSVENGYWVAVQDGEIAQYKVNFCPDCGADMRERSEE